MYNLIHPHNKWCGDYGILNPPLSLLIHNYLTLRAYWLCLEFKTKIFVSDLNRIIFTFAVLHVFAYCLHVCLENNDVPQKTFLNTPKQNRKQMKIFVFRDSVISDNGYDWQFWFIRDITIKRLEGFALCKNLGFYILYKLCSVQSPYFYSYYYAFGKIRFRIP